MAKIVTETTPLLNWTGEHRDHFSISPKNPVNNQLLNPDLQSKH
jgi:hypothetical protein